MVKQLKKWSLVFSAAFALLVSPVISAACSCASHHRAETENRFDRSAADNNHCPIVAPEAHHDEPQSQINDAENSWAGIAGADGGCCCVENAPPRPFVWEKKEAGQQNFYPALLPAQFDFSPIRQIVSIQFFTAKNIHRARSDISLKPARAPPVL